MRSISLVSRILGALVLSLTIGLVWSSSARAHPVGQIFIHAAECQSGVGGAIFEKCHGNALGGVTFILSFAGTSVEFVTDTNGVGETIAESGAAVIAVDPSVAADYLGSYVYCSNDLTGEVLFDGDRHGSDGVAIDLPSHESGLVVCDWYFITPANSDDDGTTSAPTAPTLPSTGIGPLKARHPNLSLAALLGVVALLAGFAVRK